MAQVNWTEPALEDLRAIVEFISRDSTAYAARIGTRIVEAPRRLRNFPRSRARVPEFDRDDIRELIVRPYRILYAIRRDECVVLAVIHGSRDLPSVLDPDELDH
jgi:addiction module RelE/StbE family toxin